MPDEEERQLIAFISGSLLDDGSRRIAADTLLFKERLLNSMNILDLVGYVERRLGRRLEDREFVMANFGSVRAIVGAFLRDGR